MDVDPTASLPPDVPARAALERGRLLRKALPRGEHGAWRPSPDRDPVGIVLASNDGRLPELIPIRMGRMAASPFAFLRGSAAVMAADLSTTPTMGEPVQLCGDAHLANFGIYASPERRLVFDLNDFDETHVGPWEWDLKRLAASFVVASRANGYPEPTCRAIAEHVGRSYRESMRRFAGMRALEVWYAHLDVEHLIEDAQTRARARRYRGAIHLDLDEARRRDHLAALGKLSVPDPENGAWLIRDRPPLLQRLADDHPARAAVPALYRSYLRSLLPDRRVLVEKHRLLDIALKVVGVGSVGTRCFIALFAGPAGGPLILQVKEARPSVLEPYVKRIRHRHQGERVVTGQRIMQAVSDSFLGWTRSPDSKTQYYVRQLHDMKYSIDTAELAPVGMELYANVCAWALARAHARSGSPATIAGYLGMGDRFDEALADFAVAYADQTEQDHAAFVAAIEHGRVPAVHGI